MQDRYSLSRTQARVCRVASAFLWFAAANAAILLPVFWVGIGGEWALACDSDHGCTMGVDRTAMLPSDLAEAVRAAPAVATAYEDYVRQPGVRLLLTLMTTIRILPYVALYAFPAIALAKLGRAHGPALAEAFPWLKRAAWAALAVALLGPTVDTVRGAIAAAGVPGVTALHIAVEPNVENMGLNLMLALTMLSVTWALEAGTRAARDLDEFV